MDNPNRLLSTQPIPYGVLIADLIMELQRDTNKLRDIVEQEQKSRLF